jgi:hypothetical protein
MATVNIYDMADTWTVGGTTYTAIKMNVTDTASAAASLLMDLQVGGSSLFSVSKGGLATADILKAGNYIQSVNGLNTAGVIGLGSITAPDAILARDAANVLAQRNSTNAQEFRVYETYTDASNYSRLKMAYDGGSFCYLLLTQAAGTGTARSLNLGCGSVTANGQWQINTSGHLKTTTDNTYDIGASGATRPRTIYAGTSVIAAGVNLNVETLVVSVSDETTAITTGTAKVTFRMPWGMTLTAVRASLSAASSSGTPTIDINDGGTTILSTKLTIDVSEKTSTTAATPAVISDTALADDAEITIDIDVAGTDAKGLKVYLIGTRL